MNQVVGHSKTVMCFLLLGSPKQWSSVKWRSLHRRPSLEGTMLPSQLVYWKPASFWFSSTLESTWLCSFLFGTWATAQRPNLLPFQYPNSNICSHRATPHPKNRPVLLLWCQASSSKEQAFWPWTKFALFFFLFSAQAVKTKHLWVYA